MKVKYWWSEDGMEEICEKVEEWLEESTECNHCMTKLPKGTKVSILTSVSDNDRYILCKSCVERSTQVDTVGL